MGPDSERRFAELAVQRGLAKPDVVRTVIARRDNSVRAGQPRKPLPQLLCELGVMDKKTAIGLLNELRQGNTHRTERVAPSSITSTAPRPGTLGPGARFGPYELHAQLGRGG